MRSVSFRRCLYLNTGAGNDWAGQRSVIARLTERLELDSAESDENLGPVLPVGSNFEMLTLTEQAPLKARTRTRNEGPPEVRKNDRFPISTRK